MTLISHTTINSMFSLHISDAPYSPEPAVVRRESQGSYVKGGSQLRGSNTRGERYDAYADRRRQPFDEYKFNCFSCIDEPYNNWCMGGSCKQSSGN